MTILFVIAGVVLWLWFTGELGGIVGDFFRLKPGFPDGPGVAVALGGLLVLSLIVFVSLLSAAPSD